VQIRSANAADATALAQVAAATFRLACPPDITDEAVAGFIAEVLSEERFVEYLADPDRSLLLADDDGEPIGYTMLVFGEPYDEAVRAVVPDRPAAELSKIYVLTDRHRSGLAAELMTASVEIARNRGAAVLWLGVNQQNERAQRFYAKSGFERVGTKRFWVGDHWEDDYVLARPLHT
jgi:diamine N-acetyltransferase